jgi:hypothetical protein
MATASCWIFRYEAAGLDRGEAYLLSVPDDLPCRGDDPHGYHRCVWDFIHAMCVLDEGHAGAHEFVSQSAVTLRFSEAEP